MEKVNLNFNSAYTDFVAKNKALAVNKETTPSTLSAPAPQQSVPQVQDTTLKDKLLKYSGVMALFLVPTTAVVSGILSKKSIDKAVNAEHEKLAQTLSETLQSIQQTTEKNSKANENIAWKAIALVSGGALSADIVHKISSGIELTKEEQEQVESAATKNINHLNNKANEVDSLSSRISSAANSLINKYTKNTLGFNLLSNVEARGKFNKTKYENVLKEIQNIAPSYINGVAQTEKAPLKKGDTIWSVSSEFDPIKDGGLGSVPPEFQTNFEKLGVKVPTLVPMYEAKGLSKVNCTGNKGTYTYDKTVFDIDKAAEFKMPVYRNGKVKNQDVEIFVTTHKKVGNKEMDIKPLVFVRSKDYFGNFIYAPGPMSEENEKFAFFSKAVYELAKAKLDSNAVDGFNVTNQEAFDKFNAPDGMILNDWQAAPVAAMARYKSGCENAANTLSDEASAKLKDMRMVSVCHNLMYQGSTLWNNDYGQRCVASENILNTLFDQYAHDIVENAYSGTPEATKEERDQYNDISNVLVLNKNRGEKHVNFSSMAAHLSDFFVPVSSNYAKEVTEDGSQSGSLQWVMQQRDKSGVLVGITNGNDYKNVGLENVVAKMYDLTGVELEKYNANTPLEKILEARNKNKINFYRNYVQKIANNTLSPEYARGFENVGGTVPPDLTDEELLNTPVITNAGRLVSQKGVEHLCKTIQDLFENWEEKYPGQNKPIVYLAGADGEGGTQRKFIENLKENLPAEDSKRIIFYHGFAPIPAYMAASDFFLMPSQFEPCGLTQGESLGQSTPVIANATGGLVDTIVSKGDGQYGVLTEKGDVSQKGFAKAVDEGLNIYFNDKEKYNSMVKNASKCDFSWIQSNRQGPSYDYLELFGIDRKDLPEKAELEKAA